MKSMVGRSKIEAACGGEHDKVFVPRYESHTRRLPASKLHQTRSTIAPSICSHSHTRSIPRERAHEKSRATFLPTLPHSGLEGTWDKSQVHQSWLAPSVNGSYAPVIDDYQHPWMKMRNKVSDFQVALRAYEKAREDGDKETQALRVYLASVETAAAGLVSRVQDLENLLALSTAFRLGHDAEQLRGRATTEALKEAQKQTIIAAQAIATAREATMELDKLKRETNALSMAQVAEIEHLNKEAAECRMLYEARDNQIQEFHEQFAKIQQRQLEQQSATIESSQRSFQMETIASQKRYEEAKFAFIEKAGQCDELIQALELSTAVGKAAEFKLQELIAEKKEITQKNELLEQKVKELQIQDYGAFVVGQYDQELRKVRTALGDEKAQLLDDLAQLRRSNESLTKDIKQDWLNKHRILRFWASDEQQDLRQQSPNASPSPKVVSKSLPSPSRGCNYFHDVEEGRLSIESSASASGSWHTEGSGTKDCNQDDAMRSHSSSVCCGKEIMPRSLHESDTNHGKCCGTRSQSLGLSEGLESSGADAGLAALTSKDFNLLAAAQQEIMKLKELFVTPSCGWSMEDK
ncbi:uncharacterized protein [Physcomitrium patens]|uniref:Uncharacterized protein n=1 Tax=Physcomitrium patens TaxID=3218 RepID=A0A7I4E6G0_PHYPA|nr:uncharacterized protein LOC112285059 isoform X2 [Physcomitrium patens]|eukprot:XP_024381325.1 uncharacterized protein LOC112285059 isoform X2 [Physcomitrella patens]